jgi:hypothetical protein
MSRRASLPGSSGWRWLALALVWLVGCRIGLPAPPTDTSQPAVSSTWALVEPLNPTDTSTATFWPTPVHSATASLTFSPSPTANPSPTLSPSAPPTFTPTPTISPSPTFAFPRVHVLMRAFCRYGPGRAYLYSHELKEGDRAEVHGRNASNTWLWVQPPNLDRHCWVSTSVVEVSGDIRTVVVVQTRLPHSSLYGPPQEVRAVRAGNFVTVRWEAVDMTLDDDRGYLIEATVCQNGQLVWMAVQTYEDYYEFTDERNCAGESGGRIYTVEKHGYTDPVPIPWPDE